MRSSNPILSIADRVVGVNMSYRTMFGDQSGSNRGDMADQANLSHDRHLQAQIASIATKVRKEKEAAPLREAGVTPQCVNCGDEISAARLEAVPHASRCRDCQEEHENGQARKGRH